MKNEPSTKSDSFTASALSAGMISRPSLNVVPQKEIHLHLNEILIGEGVAPAWMADIPHGVNHDWSARHMHGTKQEGRTKYARTRRGEGWRMVDFYGAHEPGDSTSSSILVLASQDGSTKLQAFILIDLVGIYLRREKAIGRADVWALERIMNPAKEGEGTARQQYETRMAENYLALQHMQSIKDPNPRATANMGRSLSKFRKKIEGIAAVRELTSGKDVLAPDEMLLMKTLGEAMILHAGQGIGIPRRKTLLDGLNKRRRRGEMEDAGLRQVLEQVGLVWL